MKQKSLAITVTFVLLTGCSVTGNITPAKDTPSAFDGAVYSGKTIEYAKPSPEGVEYRVFNQGATGFVSVEANREDAQTRATQFCRNSGRQYRLLKLTTSQPPHIFGNFPRVEIVFECIEKNQTVTNSGNNQLESRNNPPNSNQPLFSKFDYEARQKARENKCYPANMVYVEKSNAREDTIIFMCQDGNTLSTRCSTIDGCIVSSR